MSERESERLVELLLGGSAGVSVAELCRNIVHRAAERLQGIEEPELSDLYKDVRTARLFLGLSKDSRAGEGLGAVAEDLLQKVCLPYLHLLLDSHHTDVAVVREVGETVGVGLLSPHLPPTAVEEILREGLSPLLATGDAGERLELLAALLCEVFSHARPESLENLPGVSHQLSAIFPLLLSLLEHVSLATANLLLSSLLPLFISPSHLHRLSAVWTMVEEVWSERTTIELHPLSFLLSLLTCFSDVLISPDTSSPFLSLFPSVVVDLCPLLDVRGEGVFWEVLGAGIRSSDPLNRKKSMFLLHRVLLSVRVCGGEVVSEGGVFWWKPQNAALLTEVWDDLVLLLHTMEEKQVHIVKPVKSRLKSIARASTTFIDGMSVLHVSWLELALERVFLHSEAKSIVRWGVCEALSLPLTSSPLLLPPHWHFVYGPLLKALSNVKLFYRDVPTDPRPSVAALLSSFLERFLSCLPPDERGEFIHGLVVALEATHMTDTPLLHVTHSLSLLSPSPLLSPSSLLVLRSLMGQLDTLRPLLRAAVSTFLITAAANLSDLSQGVGWGEVARLLGGVRISSCLPFASPTWRKVCEWVRSVSAVTYGKPLSSFIASSLLPDPDSGEAGHSSSSLSLLLLLGVDAQIISETSLEHLLEPVMSVLSSASSRPYLSPHTLSLSLLTLNSFLTTFLSGSSLFPHTLQDSQCTTGRLIYRTLLPWLREVVGTVQRLLLRGRVGERLSLPDLTLLTSSLSSLHTFSSLYGFSWLGDISPAHLMTSALSTLTSALSSDDKQELELTCGVVGCLGAVGWVCQRNIHLPPSTLSSLTSLPPHLSLHKPPTASESTGGITEWGRLAGWSQTQHWTALHYCLTHRGDEGRREGWEMCDIWEMCAEGVELGTDTQLPIVLDCLSRALPYVDDVQISSTLTGTWRVVREALLSLPSFLSLLLHPHILFSSNPHLVQLVEKVCGEVVELGERRGGELVSVLGSTLVSQWREEWGKGGGERVVYSLLTQRHLLLQLCCYGGVGIRCMRSQEDGEEFVRLLGDQVAANSASSGIHGDAGVRVTVLSFLVGVASQQGSIHFLSQFSRDLLEKLDELTKSKPRYFINSLTHRVKQRLLQTLLLLLPHLPTEDDEELVKRILQLLQADNQTSVRHLLEWSACLLLARQPHLVPSLLLPALLPDSQFRLSRMQSVFTIALHLTHAWDTSQTVRYCKSLFPLVFPWTTSHHFVIRLYAQKTAEVVWEAGREGEEGEGSLINSCICFMRQHSDAGRFPHKLAANVGFTLLRPFSDLSAQALFETLPRLWGSVESECVGVEEFRTEWEKWGRGTKIPLYCDNGALKEMVERGGVGGGEGGKGDYTRSISHQLGVGEEGEEEKGDIQKKITRWASGAGVLEELFPGQRLPLETKQVSGGLVVVASLLTKIPNLGGLCRTCEIFGAGQLVLNSLAVLEDPQFSALSVSAQHWINISEVRLPELPSYLLAMRRAGYQLVGAEQTAQSKSISSYSFKPLTLLLLGNEREGIPVQLLHMLDECVEIPQLGVVRSLNVHVSGALLVWEYAKQHLLQTHTTD